MSTNTCTYPHLPRKRLENYLKPRSQPGPDRPSVTLPSRDLWKFTQFSASPKRSSFLGLRLTLSARQSVNWQMLTRIPVCPSFLYLLHGNPQLCFQPSLCCSPNTNGVIFFQFLRMAQRMTAASVGKTICKKFGSVRSIFDKYKDLGKNPKKTTTPKSPPRQRPVIQHITASFLLCREGHRKRILTPLTFLYIFCTGICLCQALLCRLVFDTHEDRHSYPEHIYLESQSIRTLFISQVLIKITLGS